MSTDIFQLFVNKDSCFSLGLSFGVNNVCINVRHNNVLTTGSVDSFDQPEMIR